MRTEQAHLQQSLQALQKAFCHQLGYAATPEVKTAVEKKIALVDDWIVRAENKSAIAPLARELKSGIGKALDIYVPTSPLNDAIDAASEKVWAVASEIVGRTHTPATTSLHGVGLFKHAQAKRATHARPAKKPTRKAAVRSRAKRKR